MRARNLATASISTGGVFEGFGIEMKTNRRAHVRASIRRLPNRWYRLSRNVPVVTRLPSWVGRMWRVSRFWGIPAVNLGAGSPLLAHKQDEQLPETDLLLMADLLEDWLR